MTKMRRGLDEVSTALADVQARQQSLARGSVLPRASSPSPSAHAAPSSPSPPPVSKDKTQRVATPFQWLKRRVVRRSEHKESSALEDLGSLDVVSSVSLATVRTLIGQFITLPSRREFAFVHPTTNARVDATEERDICAGDLPFICIVLLPGKEATVIKIEVKEEQQRPRPETAFPQQEQQLEQKKRRPRTVDIGTKQCQVVPATVAAVSSDSSSVAEVSDVKRDRDVGRSRQVTLLPAKEVSGDDKTESLLEHVPAKGTVSKRVTTEVKIVSDGKRASSAGLPLGVKSSQVENTEQDAADVQMSAHRERKTFVRVSSAGGDVVSTEPKQAMNVPPDTKIVQAAPDEVPNIVESAKVSPSKQQQAHDDVFQQQPVATDAATTEPTLEAPSSSKKSIHQTPGHLRRSRRFRALTAAKQAEKSWDNEDPEQLEVDTDEEVEEFLQSILEIVQTGLEDVDASQLDAAFLNYGIDYRALELHGFLIALDTELGTRCIHVRGGVDGQLKQYLLKIFPVDKENTLDPEALQRFEFALNLFAGVRGWQSPTQLRANFLEEKYPLQLIPVSDSRRLAFLRLSDRDRQLFALASSENPAVRLESWLADGMEITYVLLYGFLQSRRNSGPKALAQLDALYSRQDRIQAAVQKLSSFSFEVWKRLEFRTADIEDTSMLRRLNELTKTFLRDSKLYSGELDGSVFYPALVGYLKRKSEQLTQSLFGLLLPTPGARGPLQTTVLDCLQLQRQLFEQSETHSEISNAYMQSMGMKIIDVERINASRSSAGLGRIYVNGRESILTHYQCNLMAKDANLQLKARWEQHNMKKGEKSRYFFLGPKEIAIEYVFVRTKPLIIPGETIRREDRAAVERKEAQEAFALLCGDSLKVPPNVSIGVGINIVHADLLPQISSLHSLSTVLREYSGATSVSFGYCFTPAGQTTRVVFKVHTNSFVGKHGHARGSAGYWGLLSGVRGINRFLISASEEEAIAFCEADGLKFLNSFLQERGHQWITTKYGKPFFEYMYREERTNTENPRDDLLLAMKRTIAIIPCAPQNITKTNINIIAQMIVHFPETPDLADEAIDVLMEICSNFQDPKLTGVPSEYAAPQMTKTQKQFSTESGLEILKNTITKLLEVPVYKESIETVIVSLLMTDDISATKAGLLVHWHELLEFYVENSACTRHPAGPRFSVFLLRQVHIHFFSSTSFLEPGFETCTCGCDGHLVDATDACIGVVKIFVRLMVTDVGVTWAQDEMQGPRDCVLFLLWSAQSSSCIPAMAELQGLIFTSLCAFLERLTSSHQYLDVLSELTPPLLDLLHQQDCVSLHAGALRVLSLTFRLTVDKKAWSISLETFLESFYQLLESICDDPSFSKMNTYMVDVLFNAEHLKKTASCSRILLLLHEEHVNFVGGSGQLSPVARSRTKSLLQTLVSFCSLTWSSVLHPVCQIPALISVGWMLTSLEVADDLAQLEVDEVLFTLMENESAVVSMLAARAFVVFLFQGLQSRRTMDEYRMKRLCNRMTTVLVSSSRLILSPKRSSNTENSEAIQFAANLPDAYLKLLQYKKLNTEQQSHTQQNELDQDDAPIVDPSPVEIIWKSNEWNDPNRAMAEKLAVYLKLLVVLSSMTANVISIGSSDEIRQILLLLVRFVRERIHVASPNTTLYLLSLRNIVWATRISITKWGILDLTEPSFLRKMLLLTRDKLYQDLASGILWGLTVAYEKSNTFLLSFEVDDALATGSYFTKKIGFAVMVDNMTSKMAANRSIENDSGAMASMIVNPTSGSFFLTNYGYPFVLKLIESILRLIRAGYTNGPLGLKSEEKSTETVVTEAFGTLLFYPYPIRNQHERELVQLCRAAVNTLEAMRRISPESVLDEAARTKTTMVPLLDYPNKQVALYAVLCCRIHQQTHPTKCGKLLESDVQDKVISFFFEDDFPPIQIAALSCMKWAFADQKNLAALQSKLFPLREKIVSCLHSPDFEVKRKAILFLVEAVFRLEDQTFLDGIAEAFAADDNNGLLMELFASVSKEIAQNPLAASVLQLLVRLITKLDLVVHTGGDQLVQVVCHTLKAHSNDTFLRPMLFNFLHQIVTQDDHVQYLERKSRLDVITGLLSQELTLSELRNVANMLLSVTSNHDGIRHYLSGFESGCIPKIVDVLDGFSEYGQTKDTHKNPVPLRDGKTVEDSSVDDSVSAKRLKEMLDENDAKYLLKVTTAKAVYVSDFTEDIYELFLRLLLLLVTSPEFSVEERYGCLCENGGCSNCDPCDIIAKARCGHTILRLSAARRVLCPTYDLKFLLAAKGDPADNILNLTIKLLEVLAANYQTRVQMLRRSAKWDWMWIPTMARNAMLTDTPIYDGEQAIVHTDEILVTDTIQLLGHLSATKEVAQRLFIEKPLISMLFSYLTPRHVEASVEIRRASSFTLARLAEFPLIVRDPFFQEEMAMLSMDSDEFSSRECDTVVLANRMILARNRALLTPGLQGRSVDEGILSCLVHLLSKEDDSNEVRVLAADVLAGLLFFRVNASEEKRLRSVLWRHTRALSPEKSTKDLNHPSSKRLTAYLHNWIGPMLQKLRQSSFGTFEGNSAQMLSDELAYTCQQLTDPSVGELLRLLIYLNLSPAFTFTIQELVENNSPTCDNLDVIRPYKHEGETYMRPRSLQYVFKAPDRATREINDHSFHGSAHLWDFLRKLWELMNNEADPSSKQTIFEVVDTIAARLPHIFTSWNTESAVRLSPVAFDRRKSFLDFVIAVGKQESRILSVIDVKTLVDAVIRNGSDAAATMGREYLLLSDVCRQIPSNMDVMMKHFGLDYVNHDYDSKPSDTFRLFWRPVRLRLLPVTFTLAGKMKTTILDPSPEADLSTIFGLDLLRLLSSHIPLAVRWYAQCQGDTQVLDLMLLASKASALQMQHFLVRTFLSNLLWLTNQLLKLDHAKYHRIFTSDPRYLRCVVDLIYAPAREVQTSAIALLQGLAQRPRLFAMLSRLENLVHPIATVTSDVVVYAGEMMNKHELSPSLSHECVVFLAHILFIPFFTDLSTTELVKLSLGFRPCNQPVPNCWMILLKDCRFSALPEWMTPGQNYTTTTAFISAMKRIQKRFEGSFEVHLERTSTIMYSIDKETYMSHTTAATRRRVAMRLDNLLKTFIDDSEYRGSVRARNGLVIRLGRLLAEDRAELIRRVAYTKRVSERVLFEQMRNRQLSDLLLLLQETPLFEGIPRDVLANLAFRLGSPVEFVIEEGAGIQNLPLLLLYDERVKFEMRLPGAQDLFRGTVSRGGLLGFPPWLHMISSPNSDSLTVVHKCGLLGTIISLDVLESELPEPALEMVNDRLRCAYEAGDIQSILYLMGRDTLSTPNSNKRRLQSSASSLIVQLITADVFIESVLNDSWAIGVIVDVALAAIPDDIVLDALKVIAAMTATEAYTKRLCGKMMTMWSDRLFEQTKEIAANLLQPVVSFVSSFKLRLWQGNPEILDKFFLIQAQVACYLPGFWSSLEDFWTTKYLRTCLALLRSNQSRTCEVVGCHLSCAIPHRMDFLLNCGHNLDLNVEVAKVLLRTSCGNIIGILQLFNALGSDEVLYEHVWERVIDSSGACDGVFKLVAAGISDSFDTGDTFTIEVYCMFLYMLCTSRVNEQLELAFRYAIQDRFGILEVLLRMQHTLPIGHATHVVLRCIGALCIDTPSNCSLLTTPTDTENVDFMNFVTKELADLENHLEKGSVVDSLAIEAIFSCTDAISSVPGQREHLVPNQIMTVALRVVQILTSPPQIAHIDAVAALLSAVNLLLRAVLHKDENSVQVFDEARVSILFDGYECVSKYYSKADENIHLLRLLERYTVVVNALLSSQNFRDVLWKISFDGVGSSASFVTWMYRWMIFNPCESSSVKALNPSRASKRDRLLAIASKMQTVTWSVAIRLSEHVSIVEMLILHPIFPEVINHVFVSLDKESREIEFERATQWMKFMCFVSEQWDERTNVHLWLSDRQHLSAVKSFLAFVNVPMLLKVGGTVRAREGSFVCCAVRFLWLIVKLRIGVAQRLASMCIWDDEWIELVPLATEILLSKSSSRCTLCNLLGLLAELAFSRVALTPHTKELVDLVHAALVRLSEQSMTRKTVQVAASSFVKGYLSAPKWLSKDEGSSGEDLLQFALSHQSQRFVLYLSKTPETRSALFTADFFHPLMCRTLFHDAVVVLRVKSGDPLWVRAQLDALQLIVEILLRTAEDRDDFASLSALRSYRLVARRGQFLKHCIGLLSEPWEIEFQYTIVEALMAYTTRNTGACSEVAILRKQNQGDLMKILLANIHSEDATKDPETLNFSVICLRLYNSLIEFSFDNAKYAAHPEVWEKYRDLRLSASAHNTLLRCDLPQTLYFILRMLGKSKYDIDRRVAEEIWELASAILLQSQMTCHLEMITYALEILRCCVTMRQDLLVVIERSWNERGKHVALRLINLILGEISFGNGVTVELDKAIAKLSTQVMTQLFCSDRLCELMSNDSDIVSALLKVCEHSWRSKHQAQLLKTLLMRESTVYQESQLSKQLFTQLNEILTLDSETRLCLLEVLPCLIRVFNLATGDGFWDDILCCIVEEMSSIVGKNEDDEYHLLTVVRVLESVFDICDFLDIPSKTIFSVHEALRRQLEYRDSIRVPTTENGKYCEDQAAVVPQPSDQFELLIHSCLAKLSRYVEAEFPLVEQQGSFYFSLWINTSVCRIYNASDTDSLRQLSSLVLHCMQRRENTTFTTTFLPFWRILTRMFVSALDNVVRFTISKMLLQLLRDPNSGDFRQFVSHTCKLDLIEVLWWEISVSSYETKLENDELRELWYSLLTELCFNRDSALSIIERRFLQEFIVLEFNAISDEIPLSLGNTKLLHLLASILHVTTISDHFQFFQKEPPTMEILAELCVGTIISIFDMSAAKWNATEVLYALTMHEQTLTVVWKACYLYSSEESEDNVIKVNERLRALSEMLLQCEDNISDLAVVLTLILRICGSGQSIAILIKARKIPDCWPMVDVLVEVLQTCIGEITLPTSLPNNNLRPIVLTTNSPADFLPYHYSTEIRSKATVLALQLCHLCVSDRDFAQSLETELEFLRHLFACLAASNWEVASTAAVALSTLIRCDWYEPENDEVGVSRYLCDEGICRHLDFFSDIDMQEMFRVSPPSLFPTCFVLLVRWIRFYSVNLTFLSDVQMVERLTSNVRDELVSIIDSTETTQRDLHEKLVVSILELLLYIVSNIYSTVYKNDNGETEENEHSLFLQSLLALCQRRSRNSSGFGDDDCIVSNSQIRSRALELVQLLCSLELPHASSVEAFTNPQQMQILMMIVERSTSDTEQNAATQLMEALALKDTVKALLVRNTSLLFRLGAWLEINSLQLLAAAIIQRLATPSNNATRSTNRSLFGFSPSVQQQLAQFLFVGVEQNKICSEVSKENTSLLQKVRRMRIEVMQKDAKRSPRLNSLSDSLYVQLKFEIVDQNGLCLREFEHCVTLHNGNESSQYEFLVEPAAGVIRCSMVVIGAVASEDSLETKFEVSRGSESSAHSTGSVTLRISEEPVRDVSPSTTGVLPRLLRQEVDKLSYEFFNALSGIVAEFCKDYTIFRDPVVDLPSQILVVLAASIELSPIGKMNVTCLESLISWFPSKPTVDNFKSNVHPILRLLQGLRLLTCVNKPGQKTQHEIVLENYTPNSAQFSFLETFVELIGSVETRDLTANALNTLFIENSDVLLYLCGQFNPQQTSESTFLSLVAIAVRRNVVHCQAFLTPTAQLLLRSVFDAGIKKSAVQSEKIQGSLLRFASLVIVRLARCPITSHDMIKRTRGFEFFSRVSFEVFGCHQWIESFPNEAAENLMLSCGFLCGGLLKSVAVDSDTREDERYAALFSTSNITENALTIVETLLLFLGRTSNNESGTIDGQISYDSCGRLAAAILASLVEKLPSRTIFEQTLLQLLDDRSHKTDNNFAKIFEEQCLTGMKKCIGLTRYDFQSELNVLRLTYYSSIRAGVRTGIIPAQCSGVLQRFDQEHLLPTESLQWHVNQIGERDHMHRRLWRNSDDQLNTSSSKHLQVDDARIDSELRELILFSNEHAELLSVLTVNRKKAMTTAIRVATLNAQVLMAFHAMTSIALDFYIETAKKLQTQKKVARIINRTHPRRVSAIVNIGNTEQKIFLEWLLLLEQLAGLLCSGLHELDATYYMEIARQFRSLVSDLPMFLRKMERMGTHSRQQALMLFLDNLHRLLKRATNRNELRVVAANGSGIVDQTKPIRERLRNLDVHISTSLAVLLDTQEGMENLTRMLTAMQYMWRRMMGATSFERAMANSKESASLLKKIKEKLVRVLQILRRPMTIFRTRHETLSVQEFVDPSEIQKATSETDSINIDQSSQSASENGEIGVTGRNSTNLSSPFPFTSLELLLGHFGLESIAAKRSKQLLQSSKNKNAVLTVLNSVFGTKEEIVERMSVLELAERFHELEAGNKMSDVVDQLRQLTLEDEMPFTQLPFVVHEKVEMSLWRLMVRPIQRIRLFHFYQQMQRFVLSDPTRRRIILESYRHGSPQRQFTTYKSRYEVGSEIESPTKKLVSKSQGTRKCFSALRKKQRVVVDQIAHEEFVQPAAATGPWTAAPSAKVVISQSTLKVCDGIFSPDPFSDDAAMILLRRKLEAHKRRRHTTSVTRFLSLKTESSRSAQYRYDQQDSVLDRIRHGVLLLGARLVLLIAFWRQEELRMDLQDPVMARAFDDPHARDEYFRLYHAKKGLGELVRVWMPTSGKLGLQLWQERYYALTGTLLSIIIALRVPVIAFPNIDTEDTASATASKRNTFMTRIVYSYGVGISLLSVVSIALIAQNRFVLLEQTRLRLRPVSRYYQNVLAVTAIAVELVQLNSLAFDSAVEWDQSDKLPGIVVWLGNQGITKFGVSSVTELEALGILLLLLSWVLLLKCANKFRETSALLHRVLTKDLPALVHGFLYMSTISVFFSYLACIDCSDKYSSAFEKCDSTPQPPPFLIAHQNINCWTPTHRWYALLGLWGITFFLPIGLLAHGMSQVLFQRETLDIKYAPVLILVAQLVKAAAATVQTFFPYDPIVLASLGVIGNAALLALTLAMHSCSLWYIKYIKCSIYAAACWASLGAIHRRQNADESSTRSLNMIYFGWLSIVLIAAIAILVRVWLRVRTKQRDAERHFVTQQRLLHSDKSNGVLNVVEQKFVKAARKHFNDPLTRDVFIENAKRLSTAAPPQVLKEFMTKANAPPGSINEAARSVLFVQSARVMAKKLREHEELRRRR